MVLSIAANYSRQITATKPTLLYSKSVFKQITYKFTIHELQSNKFQRGGGATSSSIEKTELVGRGSEIDGSRGAGVGRQGPEEVAAGRGRWSGGEDGGRAYGLVARRGR
jgi:hypothetical protein